jgi:hypothetical protein
MWSNFFLIVMFDLKTEIINVGETISQICLPDHGFIICV